MALTRPILRRRCKPLSFLPHPNGRLIMTRLPLLLALCIVGAAPPPSTAVTMLAPDSETRWVPFDLTPGNQIRFAMTIDGQPAIAVLDTGVSTSVLSRAFAAAAGMKVQPRGSARAIGGNVPMGWAATQTIGFGGMMRRGGGIGVATLPAAATGGPRAVDILVGHDLIDAYAIDIDYPGMRFRLLRSGRLPFRGTSAPLAIAHAQNVYVTEAVVGGQRLAPVVVDTGDGSSLTLSQESFRATRIVGLPTTTTIAYGIAGPLETDLVIVPKLAIGKLTASNVEVRIERRGGFSAAIGVAGRIGSGFLQQYRVLLDPRAGHMVVTPAAQADSQPVKSTSGILTATETGQLRVLHVMRGSPAAASGWRAGDRICTVDGDPITTDYDGSAVSQWSVGQPGRVVTLGRCDGTTRSITLGHFY